MSDPEDHSKKVRASKGVFEGLTVGRAWPLRAAVQPGRVPTWKELMDGVQVPCIGRSWLEGMGGRWVEGEAQVLRWNAATRLLTMSTPFSLSLSQQ